MTKAEIVSTIKEGLDEMCGQLANVADPEWAKLNAIRFMENYRIMRSLENDLEDVA